jgi:hypothetical protein
MLAVIIALVLLVAGVAGIYLLLKQMGNEGTEIAAPTSCMRGRCGVKVQPPAEEAEALPAQMAEAEEQGKPHS